MVTTPPHPLITLRHPLCITRLPGLCITHHPLTTLQRPFITAMAIAATATMTVTTATTAVGMTATVTVDRLTGLFL